MNKLLSLGMLSFTAIVFACGTTTTNATPGECAADSDCGSGQACAFAIADGCGAKGTCVEKAGAACAAYSPGCACDGTEITVICTALPEGLVSKPLRNKGACGATDGGSGKACTSDKDCNIGEGCGFAAADGCGAQGKCFSRPGATCAAYAPGCACDGTVINTTCTGFPEGVFSKPLKSAGACADGGADATTD